MIRKFINDLKSLEESDFYYYFKFKKQANNFEKLWKMKASARIALKEWLLAIPYNVDTSDVLANACSELIENCIKYSRIDTNSCVEIYTIKNTVYVETMNYATEEQKQILLDFLKELYSNINTLGELYIQKLSGTIKTGNSQLGLIKIILETKGDIELLKQKPEVKDNTIVHIRLKMEMEE